MNGPTDSLALIKDLNQSYGWELANSLTIQELETLLAEIVNGWIRSDFTRLVQFLYRIDISESRLRQLLEENTEEDTGQLLARLILERLWQKIETRRQYKPGETTSDEERW
ncbi:MAG TPA: hypothetical protein VL727_13765 [Puia sp.]|jgi:hypothetical protein|nr:hypothetical protein [Puia sp.]